MEVRICSFTALNPTVKVTVINGYKKYRLDGMAVAPLNEGIDLNDRLFYNRSYFFTDDADECFTRLANNQSDSGNVLSLYPGDFSTGIEVVAPSSPAKTSILSAYNLMKIKSKDDASALANFRYFDHSIYFYLLSLSACFFIYIISKLFVTLYRRKISRELVRSSRRSHRFSPLYMISESSNDSWTFKLIQLVKKSTRILKNSSKYFKGITFLFALLCLFLTAFFYGAYSTNHIIVDPRRIIRTYNELLNDQRARVYFYEQLTKASSQFVASEPKSLKNRIFSKLLNQPGGQKEYIFDDIDQNVCGQMNALFDSMEKDHSVVISSSYSNAVLSRLLCGCSSENELRTAINVADPCELEKLEGWSINSNSHLIDYVRSRFRRLAESYVLMLLANSGLRDSFDITWQVSGSSSGHKFHQQRVCVDAGSHEKATANTEGTDIHYYASTFILCFISYFIAAFILSIELVVSSCVKRGSHSRRLSELKYHARKRTERKATWEICSRHYHHP